ncbi:MAG: AraC family transcriptional regulator, partial [Ferruginibacter sp.]
GSETLYSDQLSSDWHYHANPHFSHILSGGSIELRERGNQLQTAGTSLYYNPDIIHKNTNYQKDTRIFNLEIQSGFLTEYDLNIESANVFSPFNEHLKKNILVKILREFYINDKHSVLSIQQLCMQLFQQINHETIPQPNRHWTIVLKDYLHSHWNEIPTLNELSKVVKIHPVTISRYFSKYFNCTLGEYIRQIKIENSLPLIRSNKYLLTEIAYECDFTDQSHFTKTFKQVTGILPKEYKNF